MHLPAATLTYPENHQTPIAAALTFSGDVTVDFDWRETGPQTWDIVVATENGTLQIRPGGARLEIDSKMNTEGPN